MNIVSVNKGTDSTALFSLYDFVMKRQNYIPEALTGVEFCVYEHGKVDPILTKSGSKIVIKNGIMNKISVIEVIFDASDTIALTPNPSYGDRVRTFKLTGLLDSKKLLLDSGNFYVEELEP